MSRTRNRRLLAVLALGVAVALAGCSFGASELSEDDLTGEATYNWDTEANATFDLTVSSSAYAAVIEARNQSELEIYRETAIRGDEPIDVETLRFRYPNGTVVNATEAAISARVGSDRTTLRLPAANGTVAYTAPRSGKSFSIPTFVDGSHRIDLPGDARVTIPLLSRVSPGGYDTAVEDDRALVRWEDPSGGLSVRYYLVRDLYLFGGLTLIGVTLAIGGTAYYLLQIRRAKRKRDEVGLDIDYDDEFDDGPPPGMR